MSTPILLLWCLACVPRADFELVEVQLDATRMALNASNARHYTDVDALEAQVAALEEALALADQRSALAAEHTTTLQAEVDQTRAELARLSQLPVPEDAAPDPVVEAVKARMVEALRVHAEQKERHARRVAAHAAWEARLAPLAQEGRLDVVRNAGHTVIRIPTRHLLNEGRVSVSPRGELLVDQLAAVLETVEGLHLVITAHTDDAPYHTTEFDSSWELGFAQSMALMRALQGAGTKARMQGASAAGTEPLRAPVTEEDRRANERLELTVVQDLRKRALPAEPNADPDADADADAP